MTPILAVSLFMGAKECTYQFTRNNHEYNGTHKNVADCMHEVNYLSKTQGWKDEIKYFLCEKEKANV